MHEAAGILIAKLRRTGAAHGEAAMQVHVDDVRPVRPEHTMKDTVAQDAGIVYENVDTTEGIQRRRDDLIGVAWLADRHRGGDRFAAGLLDLVNHRLRRAGIGAGAVEAGADVANHDTRALLRHEQRDAAADSASG